MRVAEYIFEIVEKIVDGSERSNRVESETNFKML